MNSYRAKVTATFVQGNVEFTTYISARCAEEAKRNLEREGYNVLALEVLVLAEVL